MNIAIIIAMISLVGTIITLIVSTTNHNRQIYIDVITKQRLDSVNHRRDCLKKLYYYSEPGVIRQTDEADVQKCILELFDAKAGLAHRLIDGLEPECTLLEDLNKIIDEVCEIYISKKFPQDYIIKRDEIIKEFKDYNFISWQFIQEQANGAKPESIKGFDKSYRKNKQELESARKEPKK